MQNSPYLCYIYFDSKCNFDVQEHKIEAPNEEKAAQVAKRIARQHLQAMGVDRGVHAIHVYALDLKYVLEIGWNTGV